MDDRAQELINKQAPVIEPGYTFGTVTDKISSIVLTRPTSNGWFVGFGIAFLITMGLLYSVGYLFVRGVGIWGVNIPVGWGFAIVNFVWWIGIGHAGTLISAILVDQQNGVVRIPIDRAMQLIAERGLPTRPQTGTVPPSPVNVAKEAAERSDTSQKQRKKE